MEKSIRKGFIKTAKELYSDGTFWAELGLAVVPWAANTAHQMTTGSPLFPYAEIIMDVAKGPVGAHAITSFMRNYLDRDLTRSETLAYSLLGGVASRGIWSLREIATGYIPYLEKLTPRFDLVTTLQNMVESSSGGLARGLYKISTKKQSP